MWILNLTVWPNLVIKYSFYKYHLMMHFALRNFNVKLPFCGKLLNKVIIKNGSNTLLVLPHNKFIGSIKPTSLEGLCITSVP